MQKEPPKHGYVFKCLMKSYQLHNKTDCFRPIQQYQKVFQVNLDALLKMYYRSKTSPSPVKGLFITGSDLCVIHHMTGSGSTTCKIETTL